MFCFREAVAASIEKHIGQVKRHSKARAKALEDMMQKPALRCCGICYLDPKLFAAANALCDEEEPIFKLALESDLSDFVHAEEQMMDRLENVFRQNDTSGDGLLTSEEFAAMLSQTEVRVVSMETIRFDDVVRP